MPASNYNNPPLTRESAYPLYSGQNNSVTGSNPEVKESKPAKKKKTVSWNNHSLEQVKYFKQNDEPSAAGLSISEV